MNTIPKTSMTIEHHCLQLPYASLRLQKRQWLDKLVLSMESVGQLVPVVVDTSPHKIILGDTIVTAQCASLVLAYSRYLFMQYAKKMLAI